MTTTGYGASSQQVWLTILGSLVAVSAISICFERIFPRSDDISSAPLRERFSHYFEIYLKTVFAESECSQLASRCPHQLFHNSMWREPAELTGRSPVGSTEPPRSDALRVLSQTWWMNTLVLMTAFTGHMKATMMIKAEPVRIESMAELATKDMPVYVWRGTAYDALLKVSLRSYTLDPGGFPGPQSLTRCRFIPGSLHRPRTRPITQQSTDS